MWLGVFQKEGYKTVRELSSCGEKNVSSRETHVQGPEAAGHLEYVREQEEPM